MEYIRKVFNKLVEYGDDNMGKPAPNIDYLAIKLFKIKKNIKEFTYNISFPIPEGNYDRGRTGDVYQYKYNHIIELRYVEKYSDLSNLSLEDKTIFEKEESIAGFDEKVRNKELKIFLHSKARIPTSKDGYFWLHTNDDRYYIVIKGAMRDEDAYGKSFDPRSSKDNMTRSYPSMDHYSPSYRNIVYPCYSDGKYKDVTFCTHAPMLGSEVFLVIYKGHLPSTKEYTDVYKEFDNNKQYHNRKNKRYRNVQSSPQWNRLKEADLKGSTWKRVKFDIQYTYLEENNFLDVKDIIKLG